MSARTRIFGAIALAFAILVTLAVRSAPADQRTCFPSIMLVMEAIATDAEFTIWRDDKAARAFTFLREHGYDYSGDRLIIRLHGGWATMSVVDAEGMICDGAIIGPQPWRQLRDAVEGMPA